MGISLQTTMATHVLKQQMELQPIGRLNKERRSGYLELKYTTEKEHVSEQPLFYVTKLNYTITFSISMCL